MFGVLVFIVLCQQSIDPTRSAQAAEMVARARDSADILKSREITAKTKRDFAERFNRLITALKDFEEAYSTNHGQVWPAKQAAKLDLAMRELSSSPGWVKRD